MSNIFKTKWQKFFKRYIVDASSSMALGVFASLIIGLIFEQIAKLFPLEVFNIIISVLSANSPVIGAAIGAAIAYKLECKPQTLFAAVVAGAIGYKYSGPVGAYFATLAATETGKLVAGKTSFDILLVPFVALSSAGLTTWLLTPPILASINALQSFLETSTLLMPIPMGIIISTVFGLVLTAPISSAALAAVIFTTVDGSPLSQGLQLAAGAATVGCCCQMVGFAVASYRENKLPGLIVQGIGTSMLQFGNIMAKPIIWLPPTITSAILGIFSTTLFKMKNASAAAGMGTSGLVGQIGTITTMQSEGIVIVLIKILIIQIILPAIITLLISEFMRKKNWIKFGDMKLDLK
ncbi:MAG: PTS sugar transporter subunit IIC [Christensenellaceae bacterium]|nr:PTS sugar transporter subunit IIC [Christensenellaceae bacterium]